MAESEDPVKVKLALKVCREDLTKAQVELNRLHAEYGDVVPRRDWESLDRSHQENVQKVGYQHLYAIDHQQCTLDLKFNL